ncbi:MAG: sulfurtransferase complex subunit TusD [Pseudomonadota bacterium]
MLNNKTINVLVTGSALDSQASLSALRFCYQAAGSDYQIQQVFFFAGAVNIANALRIPLADEFDHAKSWQTFSKENGVTLLACIASSERRGVIGLESAADNAAKTLSLATGFSIAGLGQLQDAMQSSDQMVVFK